MTVAKHIAFLFNLPQDVNILRPIAYLAAREFDAAILFLLSANFLRRDRDRSWQREIAEIGADVGASVHIYATPLDALAVLQGKGGVILAGSESSLSAHAETHNVFRIAPASFLKVTLQHGLECVGFLQSRQHDIAHGRNVTFAADVICGWGPPATLKSLRPSERPKLYVTGPSTVLQVPPRSVERGSRGGLVCENLHSVRLKASGYFAPSFMESFLRFSEHLGDYGVPIGLRLHPSGQFLKNPIALPDNVSINNLPIYKVDLASYSYGISAPSTVLLDFALAGVPVAVWRDAGGVIDADNYEGLIEVASVDDWFAFARDAALRPDAALSRQRDFLTRLAIVTDRAEVYRRFARLLGGGAGDLSLASLAGEPPAQRAAPRRVLFIANGMIPTLELSFLKPLRPMIDSGEIVVDFVGETDIIAKFGRRFRDEEARGWLLSRIASFDPELIACCRYSGPHADAIVEVARSADIPLLYHIDDDLLNIPRELGERKFRAHNRPERLGAVKALLNGASLVYCSTLALKTRLRALGFHGPMVAGHIYCSGEVIEKAELRPVRKIGYMGFDHAYDLALVLAALVDYLRQHPNVEFELFGSIPLPAELAAFGNRVTKIDPIRGYDNFIARFAELKWDIGICPLAPLPFNILKANTKWVEYTSVGAAVVASRGTIYDACCAGGSGLLAGNDGGEWLAALNYLTDDPQARFQIVRRAQEQVARNYGPDRLRRQVVNVFGMARLLGTERHLAGRLHGIDGPIARSARPILGDFAVPGDLSSAR